MGSDKLSLGVHCLYEGATLPEKKTMEAAAYDVCVCFDGNEPLKIYNGTISRTIDYVPIVNEKKVLKISSGETVAIPTGLILKIPHGYCVRVLPRSGVSLKMGLIVTNSPGLIDSDYKGELKIIVSNISSRDIASIEDGMRIAQIKIEKVHQTVIEECSMEEIEDHVSHSDRIGGFGSTGM